MSNDSAQESGHVTGTLDKDYNLIWFTEVCLADVLRLGTYIQDADRAGDTELVQLFTRAQAENRKGADQGKALLKSRLSNQAQSPNPPSGLVGPPVTGAVDAIDAHAAFVS